MRSSLEHLGVIDEYLQLEVALGRIASPFSSPPFTIGVIPKNSQPGKWRLILDLSLPQGHSVNDGIPKSPFSIQYVTVYCKLLSMALCPGSRTLMAKFDVASAYRIVAVHPKMV